MSQIENGLRKGRSWGFEHKQKFQTLPKPMYKKKVAVEVNSEVKDDSVELSYAKRHVYGFREDPGEPIPPSNLNSYLIGQGHGVTLGGENKRYMVDVSKRVQTISEEGTGDLINMEDGAEDLSSFNEFTSRFLNTRVDRSEYEMP